MVPLQGHTSGYGRTALPPPFCDGIIMTIQISAFFWNSLKFFYMRWDSPYKVSDKGIPDHMRIVQ